MNTLRIIGKSIFIVVPFSLMIWYFLSHLSSLSNARKEGVFRRLELSKSQYEFIRKSQATSRNKISEINSQLALKLVELETEYDKANPDMNRLDSLCGEIWQLKGKRAEEYIIVQLELERKILTPKQLGLLEEVQGRQVSANGSPGTWN